MLVVFVEAITMFVLIIYHWTFFRFYGMYNSMKKEAPIRIVFSIIVNSVLGVAVDFSTVPYYMLTILLAALFVIEIGWIYDISIAAIFFGAGFHIFHIYIANGISRALISIILKIDIFEINNIGILYAISSLIAMLLMVLWAIVVRKLIIQDDKMKQLLSSRQELWFVAICEFMLLLYLLIADYGQFYSPSTSWHTFNYLVSYIMSYMIQFFILNNSIRVSYLLEMKVNTKLLKEQLNRQMRHYNTYKKYTENFKAIKHDYKNMLTSVKFYVENREIEKAVQLLDEIDDVMQKSVIVQKKYSNNLLLDAILQDASNMCEEKEIMFTAEAYLPEDISLSDIDIVRVFTNLINNALEAVARVAGSSERSIKIDSHMTENWVAIIITNTFNGKLRREDNQFLSTKEDKYMHGYGLQIVTRIIEGLGGLVQIDADTINKVFQVKITIVRNSK